MTWQAYQQPFTTPQARGPNPAAAAVLGLIPGVGAMYNGQFFKGLIHVVVFAVLVSVTEYHGIFGLFIAAWILYQSFEAFHTARALRDGQPPPDPLGLNELGNWLNLGGHSRNAGQPNGGPAAPGPATQGPASPAAGYQQPYPGAYQAPYESPYSQAPGQIPYQQVPFSPPPAGFVDSAAQPAPPLPPLYWRRREPIGAIVLIALGLLFLLGQLDIFHGRLLEFTWPLMLIALGVWLIVRRLGDSHGGSR
jgi:TM2 domain-containing membrane protein YozV